MLRATEEKEVSPEKEDLSDPQEDRAREENLDHKAWMVLQDLPGTKGLRDTWDHLDSQ